MKLNEITLFEKFKEDKKSAIGFCFFIAAFLLSSITAVQCLVTLDFSFFLYHGLFVICFVVFNILLWALSLAAIIYLSFNMAKKQKPDKLKYFWIAVIALIASFLICFGYYWSQCQNLKNKYDKNVFLQVNICDYSELKEASLSNSYMYPIVEELFSVKRVSFNRETNCKNGDKDIYAMEKVLVIKNAKLLNRFLFNKTVNKENLEKSNSDEYMYKNTVNSVNNSSQLLLAKITDDCLVLYEIECNDINFEIDNERLLKELQLSVN